jgi:hypothetical protein
MTGVINYLEHFYQQALQDPDELERNASDYPYSSLTGFLLLYHYKKTNHPGFEKLAKKTALQFKNINWLQFLLDQTADEKTEPAIISPSYSEEEKNEVNEINPGEVTQTLYDQNSGYEVEEVTENQPLPEENFEIPQQAEEKSETAEISKEQNFQKEYSEETAETTEPPSGEISFEPLHTVDYFASQGIKITEEPVTTDKLGNQMKSFTAWLKSMKKLHLSKVEEQDADTERIIQNSAEESNINTEVLTEAMAEVLIKQDKREKAIEMYNKLSLINPSKSAYFATKIESIKSS